MRGHYKVGHLRSPEALRVRNPGQCQVVREDKEPYKHFAERVQFLFLSWMAMLRQDLHKSLDHAPIHLAIGTNSFVLSRV